MYRYMQSSSLPSRTDVRWFHSETVTAGTSDPLIIPAVGRDAAVAVITGTSARVEYSLSGYAAIENDTAIWLPWPSGDVTTPTSDAVSGAVTALRLVTTGESTWEVTV